MTWQYINRPINILTYTSIVRTNQVLYEKNPHSTSVHRPASSHYASIDYISPRDETTGGPGTSGIRPAQLLPYVLVTSTEGHFRRLRARRAAWFPRALPKRAGRGPAPTIYKIYCFWRKFGGSDIHMYIQ